MKTIFICEYVTGGGYINKKIPKKLFLQAKSIVNSLLNYFKKIPNLKKIYSFDARFNQLKKKKNIKCFKINKKPIENWKKLLRKTDIYFPIAPETGNKLINLIKLNKFKKKMISNSLNTIKLSSSKYKTYLFFKKNSIPTVKTFNKKRSLKISKNWVAKPDDGAGSEENFIFSNKIDLFNFLKLNKNFVIQPLIKGVSYSANIVPHNKKAHIINFNKQKILYKKNKIVFKGTKLIKKIPHEKKIKEYIKNIFKNFSGINNFFGIDFIISKKKIFFIDINPRITTSYKNINKNLRINIAKKILNTL